MNAPASLPPSRKRGGRPRAPSPRNRLVGVMLTPSESEAFAAKVHDAGFTKSEALRLLITQEELPQKVFGGLDPSAAKAYRNLQLLHTNVNQVARAFNSQRDQKIPLEIAVKMHNLMKLVAKEIRILAVGILQGGEQDPHHQGVES